MRKRLGITMALLALQACQSAPEISEGPPAPAPGAAASSAPAPVDQAPANQATPDLAVGPLAYQPPSALPPLDATYVVPQPVDQVADAMVQDLMARGWNITDHRSMVDGRRIVAEYSGPTAGDVDCGLLTPARPGDGIAASGVPAATPLLNYQASAESGDVVQRELQLDGHRLIDLHDSAEGTLVQRRDLLILTRFTSVRRGPEVVDRKAESIRFEQGKAGRFKDSTICIASAAPLGAERLAGGLAPATDQPAPGMPAEIATGGVPVTQPPALPGAAGDPYAPPPDQAVADARAFPEVAGPAGGSGALDAAPALGVAAAPAVGAVPEPPASLDAPAAAVLPEALPPSDSPPADDYGARPLARLTPPDAAAAPAEAAPGLADRLALALASPLGPPPFYRANQRLTFTASVNRPAYLYCYYGEAGGQVWQIYPNPANQDAQVPAGSSVEIPGRNAGFDILLDQPGAQEAVYCFASSANVGANLAGGVSGQGPKPLSVGSLDDIVVAYHSSGAADLAEARLPIAVVPE